MTQITRFSLVGLAALVLPVLGASTAQAFPLGNLENDGAQIKAPLLRELTASGVDFTAIVALDDCSGSVIRFKTSLPTDQALVLTNGHCYEGGFPSPGQVIVNEDSERSFDLLNADASDTIATLQADQVLYSTMTKTDVTLYRTTTTYAELKSRYGVEPLTLSDQHPAAGVAIRVVSGYWKKIYACTIDHFVFELDEGGWIDSDSILYKQPGCATIGGTSGSPVIQADTKEMIGINNTGNDSGQRCTEDNPCEKDQSGNITVTKGASYGQETYWFYSCLTASNTLDLNKDGCLLPKP